MKIILCGGGTAGHIWPIVAIGESLQTNRKVKLLYVGSYFGQERAIAAKFQLPFRGIFVGKWRPYVSFLNFLDLFKTFFGLIQGFFIILFFSPQVVFSKGGYVTFPILYWAKIFKIPVVAHESDVVMGKANKWVFAFAKKICLGFPPKYYKNLPFSERFVYTGTPVRREFFDKIPIAREKPTILITGGSQGAQKINQIIGEILPELIKIYDVYHLCGEKNFENLKGKIQSPNYHLIGFSLETPALMRNADLIVSRAGANTLAEIAALGKSSILIPLSTAYADHQTENAQIYSKHNAAVVISEKNLTGSSLLSIINRLMDDEHFRKLLGHHAQEFAKKDATGEIIDIIFSCVNKYED
jgi:UDP-N-acetylglucosamine--N-acetylmuramyl-(pentapeptide) pyrophosphoryl-undecaprenol N-acetylglucosamine transferase